MVLVTVPDGDAVRELLLKDDDAMRSAFETLNDKDALKVRPTRPVPFSDI